VVVSYVRK
jgi:chaperonin GroEL